jgi:WhiB family transcriptional regulator, redox-sensing transcriptional regulator
VEDTPDQIAWMAHALCRGTNPDRYFPSDGVGVEAVQRICVDCPVRLECLEYALRHGIDQGVWGGASERQRRRIRRQRRALAEAGTGTQAETEAGAETEPASPAEADRVSEVDGPVPVW